MTREHYQARTGQSMQRYRYNAVTMGGGYQHNTEVGAMDAPEFMDAGGWHKLPPDTFGNETPRNILWMRPW